MKLILLEKVDKLGLIGDTVDVKDGYARNFLLPKKKAMRATEANIAFFKSKENEIREKNEKTRVSAESLASKILEESITVVRQASDSGVLFGSVTSRDIVNELDQRGISGIKRQDIVIDRPIKTLGDYLVKIYVHPEVVVDLPVRVIVASQDVGPTDLDFDEIENIENIENFDEEFVA